MWFLSGQSHSASFRAVSGFQPRCYYWWRPLAVAGQYHINDTAGGLAPNFLLPFFSTPKTGIHWLTRPRQKTSTEKGESAIRGSGGETYDSFPRGVWTGSLATSSWERGFVHGVEKEDFRVMERKFFHRKKKKEDFSFGV